MANERFPDDPYRSNLGDDDFRRPARLDNELQPDPELADVTNYIRNSWGNAAPLVTPAQVKKARMQ